MRCLSSKRWLWRACWVGLFVLGGCDDDPVPSSDVDAGLHDAGTVLQDGGTASMDGGMVGTDARVKIDAGLRVDAGIVVGALPASMQIADILAAPHGPSNLPIEGALVTYVRPAIGSEPPGFFLQAERIGPAIFVRVDPATLTPTPTVGQLVDLRATDLSDIATNQGRREILAVAGWSVRSTGNDVSTLVQDISSVPVTTMIDTYASELITTQFAIRGLYRSAATGFSQISIDTPGVSDSDAITLRVPDTLIGALNLEQNCQYTVRQTPLWRANASVQILVFEASEVTLVGCDPPTPDVADATNERTIVVRFGRPLDTTSVLPAGTQFTVMHSGGGTIPVASAAAAEQHVVLGMGADLLPGQFYTVFVASTVRDTVGTGVPAASSSTMLSGYTPHLVINEIDYAQPDGDTREFVEIHNPGMTAIALTGLTLYSIDVVDTVGSVGAMIDLVPNSAGITELPAGGFLVVRTASSAGLALGEGVPSVTLGTSLPKQDHGFVLAATGACHDVVFYEGTPMTPATIVGCGYEASAGVELGTGDISLARIPNGSDFDESGLDFVLRTPSPGAINGS